MNTGEIIILIAVILIVLFACFAFSYFAFFVSMPKNSLERSIEWEKEHNFYRDFDTRTLTPYLLKSFDGYEIHAFFVPNRDFPDSRKFMIISHGYTSSRYGALKYLNMWMELGFQCIIYDDRFHGNNLKTWRKPCTLGINEAKDLMTVINDAYERYGSDIYLGLQGESMGSALEITALKYKPNVRFVVNDCGFYELTNVLVGRLKKWFHLHKWLLWPSSLFNRIIFGWSFIKNRPVESLKDNTVPICFVHGEDDDFIPPFNSFKMAEANPAYSEVHIFPGAQHAECMLVDEPRYIALVKAFLEKVERIEAGEMENKRSACFEKRND